MLPPLNHGLKALLHYAGGILMLPLLLLPDRLTIVFLQAGGIFNALGNAAFLGVLGAGAFFGYYTWRYTSDELEHMLDEQTKPENHFPGSQQVSNADAPH